MTVDLRTDESVVEPARPGPSDPKRRIARDTALGATGGALVLLLVWSRLVNLSSSLYHDEAFTIINYIDGGPSDTFFGRYTANNHMLFSVLSWATTFFFGESEATYRAWSALPGIAAVVLVTWWAWRRLSPGGALVFLALATIAPVHLELVPQVRGYGLAFLAAAGLLVFGVRASDHARTSDIWWFGLAGWVGICTLPTLAVPFTAHAAVLGLRSDLRRRAIVVFTAVGITSFLFYSPVFGALVDERGKNYPSPPLAWYGFISEPYSALARSTLDALFPEPISTRPILVAVYVGLAVLGCRRLLRRHDTSLLAHLAIPVVATYAGISLLRVWYTPRYGVFVLFHVLMLLAVGVLEAWTILRRWTALRAVALVTAAALLVVGANNAVDQTDEMPFENWKLVAEVVSGAQMKNVVTNTYRPHGLEFYLGRRNFTVVHGKWLWTYLCFAPPPFVFIEHNYKGDGPVDPTCLQGRDAARVGIVQNRRGPMSVWFVTRELPAQLRDDALRAEEDA